MEKKETSTYSLLEENIFSDLNLIYKEKVRHNGKTFKLNANNNAFSQQVELINDDSTDDETFYDALDSIVSESAQIQALTTKQIQSLLPEQIAKFQTIVQEQAQTIAQLTKQIEELKKSKQKNINFENFRYHTITFYDKKQRKKTQIEKIHEEILPINNEIYFITTFKHTNQAITEEIICFYQLTNGKFEVIKQLKEYENINKYKDDLLLIEKQSDNLKKVYIESVSIGKFLKDQNSMKIKPANKQWLIWAAFTALAIVPIICAFLPFVWPAVTLVLIDKIAISAFLVTTGIAGKIFSSLFSPITKKVESWISNKICRNEEQKIREKKERKSIIKNLTSDNLETKLQTQYDILKQELDNRKVENAHELIINSKKIISNQNLELENNQNFDLSILDTINHQEQPSTSLNANLNKVNAY